MSTLSIHYWKKFLIHTTKKSFYPHSAISSSGRIKYSETTQKSITVAQPMRTRRMCSIKASLYFFPVQDWAFHLKRNLSANYLSYTKEVIRLNPLQSLIQSKDGLKQLKF